MSRLRSSSVLPNLEISSPVGFEAYFRHEIPRGGLSHTNIMANLAIADSPEEFGRRLLDMHDKELAGGVNMATEFFARLEDYTGEIIPKKNISSILSAIFDVGDQLWSDERHQGRAVFFGAYTYIMRVVYQLSQRLSEQERFDAFSAAFAKGRALATICGEARSLAGEHGLSEVFNPPLEEKQLTIEHLYEIQRILLERVRAAAEDGSLLDSRMPAPLYFWDEAEEGDAVQHWVAEYTRDDKGLVEFLETFLVYSRDMDGERIEPHIHPDSVRQFIALGEIIDRARRLADADWLSDTQRDAVSQFVREFDTHRSDTAPDAPEDA
ncbi:MAG: hypothetical protein JW941_03555 [Candidatus Coatesbacteria bacterium]|nr:hypothetical protein [Candidatus Coatesbacteria bacterium]